MRLMHIVERSAGGVIINDISIAQVHCGLTT